MKSGPSKVCGPMCVDYSIQIKSNPWRTIVGIFMILLKANSGVRKSVGREAYYAQTGIYVWCKYNLDIKTSKI